MMKNLLPFIFIVILTSCSNEVPYDRVVERNGLIYEVNSEIPFTGKTIEYYFGTNLTDEVEDRIKSTGFYNKGVKDGLFETFHLNGQLMTKGTYSSGKKEGFHEEFLENGQLSEKSKFVDGTRVSFQQFDKNNNLINDLIYIEGEKNGLETTLYDDGQVNKKQNFKNGKLEGLEEVYHTNGQLQYRGNYIDGEMDGLRESYWENGQEFSKYEYVGGEEKDGTYENFYEDGSLWYKTTYLNGRISENYSYYEGSLFEKDIYFYDEDGKSKYVKTYQDDKVERISYFSDVDGEKKIFYVQNYSTESRELKKETVYLGDYTYVQDYGVMCEVDEDYCEVCYDGSFNTLDDSRCEELKILLKKSSLQFKPVTVE